MNQNTVSINAVTDESKTTQVNKSQKLPQSQTEWREVAQDFEKKYQFWNCLGALDGKHIAIKKHLIQYRCISITKDFIVSFY